VTEFNFDEGTGDTVTSKDSKLIGTLVGPPTFSTDTPSGLKGDFSIQFAAGQRVMVDDPETLLALDQADPLFTIQAWVKFGAHTPSGLRTANDGRPERPAELGQCHEHSHCG
jgi:hypothetical protein